MGRIGSILNMLRQNHHTAIVATMFCLGLLIAGVPLTLPAGEPFRYEVEAMTLDNVATDREEQVASNLMWILRSPLMSGNATQEVPASTTVHIPADGIYQIWARYQVSPARRKAFSINLAGQELVFCWLPYGKDPQDRPDIFQGREADDKGFIWTREEVNLKSGPLKVEVSARPNPPEGKWRAGGHPPTVAALAITNDPNFDPAKK